MPKSQAILDAEARWAKRYEGLTAEERVAKVKQETEEGLKKLQEQGIKPTMTWEEIRKMTRGR